VPCRRRDAANNRPYRIPVMLPRNTGH